MIETYIGRQPILDSKGKCVAYELLYRSKGTTEAVFLDDTEATTRVIINLIHNIGVSSIIGDKIGYINVDDHTLLSDAIFSVPKEQFVFEILEYTKMSVAIIERVRHLHDIGYRFALDDFSCDNVNIEYFKALFPFVDIIKIDLLATDIGTIDKIAEKFKPHNVKLLAEKVEDLEVFERCREAGFELFQGYFFEKPSIVTGKKIEPSVANAMDLINTLYTTSDMNIVTQKFSLYPELTFNLLRYINSSKYNFKNDITSIKQILNLLGPSRLRSWLGLFLYGGSQERLFQDVIINAATFRANMMRELVNAHGKQELCDEAFLVGSLSLIDTYLQVDMHDIVAKIQLSKSIKDALLSREGYLGKFLSITEKLEKTDRLQSMIGHLAPKINLSPAQLYTLYCKANDFEITAA
ncbi:MAG: EAL domain-containing protein [Sulfuricurvum sp.]|nr:EAL domain-containing protein [Sulfuricurvum sp.]MDP3022035.1 EAL domain-containing protein [Sulfuricurvum sp.]MDP3120401.1 EAL domain-containing protein [Sulfuricurvum sp.]